MHMYKYSWGKAHDVAVRKELAYLMACVHCHHHSWLAS